MRRSWWTLCRRSSVEARKLLVLIGSPRRAGNSATLAAAVQHGAEQAGAEVAVRYIDDFITSFLRDCRACRLPDGECAISDRFRTLFFDDFLPADGVVFCSPVYWYGLSAQVKAFFDRTFCYYAASYPNSPRVIERMSGKRIRLVLASGRNLPGRVTRDHSPDPGILALYAFRIRRGCARHRQQPQ